MITAGAEHVDRAISNDYVASQGVGPVVVVVDDIHSWRQRGFQGLTKERNSLEPLVVLGTEVHFVDSSSLALSDHQVQQDFETAVCQFHRLPADRHTCPSTNPLSRDRHTDVGVRGHSRLRRSRPTAFVPHPATAL